MVLKNKTESVYHDAQSSVGEKSNKGFMGNILDTAKTWINSMMSHPDFDWITQLTSDVSVLSMLWCWLVTKAMENQFDYTARRALEEPDNPGLNSVDWTEHSYACRQRLKFWSRNLIIVLTIKIILRVSRNELFTKKVKEMIDTVIFLRKIAPEKEEIVLKEDIQMQDPSEFIEDIEEVNPQSDFGDHAPYVVGMMLSICSVLTGLKTRAPLSNAILTMAKTSRQQRDNLCEMLITAFEHVGSLLKKVTKDNVISDYFYVDKISDPRVENITVRIKGFLAESYTGTDVIDPNRQHVYVELKSEIKELLAELDFKSYDFKFLSEGLKEIEKQSTILAAQTKALSGDRVEPVGILFMGTPGTKKISSN
jgi:hypothetical protein